MSKAKAKATACDSMMHCWHVRNTTTDGLSKKGYDTVFCCFCGAVRRRKWEYVRDPNHGSYADLLVRRESDE